jgi:hypothetical protein
MSNTRESVIGALSACCSPMLKRKARPRNPLEDAHSFLDSVEPTLGLAADMWSLGMHRHRAIFRK